MKSEEVHYHYPKKRERKYTFKEQWGTSNSLSSSSSSVLVTSLAQISQAYLHPKDKVEFQMWEILSVKEKNKNCVVLFLYRSTSASINIYTPELKRQSLLSSKNSDVRKFLFFFYLAFFLCSTVYSRREYSFEHWSPRSFARR